MVSSTSYLDRWMKHAVRFYGDTLSGITSSAVEKINLKARNRQALERALAKSQTQEGNQQPYNLEVDQSKEKRQRKGYSVKIGDLLPEVLDDLGFPEIQGIAEQQRREAKGKSIIETHFLTQEQQQEFNNRATDELLESLLGSDFIRKYGDGI